MRLHPTDAIQDISHDQAVNDAYLKDQYVKLVGTFKSIGDMLDGVRCHRNR